MTKFIKPGKVVILLHGRHAGKKAVIVKNFDEGTQSKQFSHAIVAGIERYPLKVAKGMSQKKIALRSRVKPFIKTINYNHFLPTRYNFDIDLKSTLTAESFKDPSQRITAKKTIRKAFHQRYLSGKNKWFFQKLRF